MCDCKCARLNVAHICKLITVFKCVVICFCGVTAAVENADNSGSEEVHEFCQLETMQARCRWNSEVIVMTSARWGRMRTGRCLSIHPDLMALTGHNPLFLGCSADVLEILDRKCSGRSECNVRIPDSDLDNVKPCYPDLKNHLETSFTCVRVIQESRTCNVQVTVDPHYVSSSASAASNDTSPASSSSSSSCGSVSHPWRLEAAAGQRINISLIDFSAAAAERNGPSRDVSANGDVTSSCRQFGFILEKWNKKNTTLCGAEQREGAVYTSETNSLDIILSQRPDNNKYNFLVRIQAVGCTNIVPPDNAWLKRSGNDIIIGCYSSQQTWRLKCDGHKWKGTIGTCPELYAGPVVAEPATPVKQTKYDSQLVLGIVIAIGAAALVVCLTVICIGCMCLRRSKLPSAKKLSEGLLLNGSVDNNETTACSQRLIVNRELAATATQPFSHTLNYGNTQQQQQLQQPVQTQCSASTAQYFVPDNNQLDNRC